MATYDEHPAELATEAPGATGEASWRQLPATPGTIIAWTMWYDGPRYGCAVLETDDETGNPIWFRAGFDDPVSPEQLRNLLRDHWTEVGQAPDPDR